MRQPGIEPGSTAWKAAMLTTIPLTLTGGLCSQMFEPSIDRIMVMPSKMSLP